MLPIVKKLQKYFQSFVKHKNVDETTGNSIEMCLWWPDASETLPANIWIILETWPSCAATRMWHSHIQCPWGVTSPSPENELFQCVTCISGHIVERCCCAGQTGSHRKTNMFKLNNTGSGVFHSSVLRIGKEFCIG